MTRIDRSALLPYAAEQLYRLVNDIEAYPEYMSGCVGAEILRRDADIVDARLDLAQGGISHSFATRNRCREPHGIEVELLDGPFEYLAGQWQFSALSDAACKVRLTLDFSLNSRLLGAAARRLFDGVTAELVDAVTRRADHLYG